MILIQLSKITENPRSFCFIMIVPLCFFFQRRGAMKFHTAAVQRLLSLPTRTGKLQ